MTQWIRPWTLNREVPGSNLLAAAVVPLGKALYPHCLDLWKGLKAVGPLVVASLTLIRLGGHDGPPSTFCTITLQCAKLSPRHFMTIFFRVSRTFWHRICDARGTVPQLRNILYMHVSPKKAQKFDFVYKSNANWVFSVSSYKYAYFYSQWLKLICFSIIVFPKMSATNFAEKTTKTKGRKNKEIHKKFIKQWNTRIFFKYNC